MAAELSGQRDDSAARQELKSSVAFHAPPSFMQGVRSFLFALHETPVLRAFRHGVMLVMPLLLAAAIAILVNNFPLLIYQRFMTDFFGSGWKEPGILLYNSTIEILALASSFTLSNCLMSMHNEKRPAEYILPVFGALTSFVCLLVMIGPRVGAEGMLLPWAGIRGLFGALVLTFGACGLFLYLSRVRKLRLSFYAEGTDSIWPHIFDSLLPMLLTILFFIALKEALVVVGIESVYQAFYDAIRSLFAGASNSFSLGALYAFLVQVCWFFGIHGADLLDPVTHQVLAGSVALNSIAINNHEIPPHIFTKYFFDVYIYMGGSGTTLGLIAAIFLRSKDPGARRVAGISLLPSLFNINELLVFGLPIVLNPSLMLPFLFVPLVLLIISYIAVATGLCPLPVYQVDWITPPLVNVLISTDSWRGVALQLFNLMVATLLYMPFASFADQVKIAGRRKALEELVAVVGQGVCGLSGKRCSDMPGSVGALARALIHDMRNALRGNDGSIRLYYQPRIDMVKRSVPSVEALLRWQHSFYGDVPAVLTLALSQDAKLARELDTHIMEMAFEQQAQWRKAGVFTTTSVNLSESQLGDPDFPRLLDALYARYSLPAEAILLEVREELALHPQARYLSALEAIHMTGVNIAVDNFGKGYQSISQMKRLPLSELQIDGSLVSGISNNKNSQDVIGAIQEMCLRMGIQTSAEYVETSEQLEILLELNFSMFQGRYFSEPIPADQCMEFIQTYASDSRAAQKRSV